MPSCKVILHCFVAGTENPKKSNAESNVPNKSLSGGKKENVEQSSAKRKRSCSPPSDNKNAKLENNSLDKNPKCGSKNSCNTTQPVSKDNPKKEQSSDTNSGENPTQIIKTGSNKSQLLNTGQNLPKNEPLNKKQNCDLNSGQNNNPASEIDREPSIAEVFSKMQELAFKDPVATNAIFFNLLPSELRQSFSDFEKTQADALNKLKQSFVSCYFTQCNASTSEENPSDNAETQSSSVFFFPPKPCHSKTENDGGLPASKNSSDSVIRPQETAEELREAKTESGVQKSDNDHSVSKPQGTISEVNTESDVPKSGNSHSGSVVEHQGTVVELSEVKTDTDVKKSGKKRTVRQKAKKENAPIQRDEGLTLYTQRCKRRHQN